MSIDAGDLYEALAPFASQMQEGALLARAVVVLEISGPNDFRAVVAADCDANGLELYPWDATGMLHWAANDSFSWGDDPDE